MSSWRVPCDQSLIPSPVPDGAPTGIVVTNVSSHALLIRWSPPDIPNGVITAYTIYVIFNIPFDYGTVMLDGLTLNYTLNHLSPHQLVRIQMTANTNVGEGPKSTTANGRTNPSGARFTYDFCRNQSMILPLVAK